jgi:NADH-quinone oxidoreductase subunit L
MRRAMPFTFGAFLVAALALAAFPGFSGYFSKDEILAFAAERGGGYWIIYVVGSLAALMTAVYAFRMVFRVFGGPPNEQARELERGHLPHEEPFNPATGEPEDTDVGYPGPEHHIAEREGAMKVAMATLAVLTVVGGVVQIPGVTHVVEHFLDPSFSDSQPAQLETGTSVEVLALVVGAVASLSGIAIAWFFWVRAPGSSVRLAERLRGLHTFLLHKWYFDELYDHVVVRPMQALGAGASSVFERTVVQGMVGGATLAVRVGNSFVRVAQSGIVRYYALLLVAGLGGLSLYFLIVSR